jgi:hypothetical protein
VAFSRCSSDSCILATLVQAGISRLTYIVQGPIYFTRISNELNSSESYFFVWTQRNQLSIYINIFEVQGVLFNLWLSEMSAISCSGGGGGGGLLLRDSVDRSAFTRLDAILFIAMNMHINGRFHRHNSFWRGTVKTFSKHILVITQHPTILM